MAIPDICRQHVQDIVDRAQSQHKEKITALHQRFKEYHTQKMTDLHSRATDKLRAAKERIQNMRELLPASSRHHAVVHNELENLRDAWRTRDVNPGNVTTAVGRLMRLHQSMTTGRDPEGKFAGAEETIGRYQRLHGKKLSDARKTELRRIGVL